jgi:hypothetical protein
VVRSKLHRFGLCVFLVQLVSAISNNVKVKAKGRNKHMKMALKNNFVASVTFKYVGVKDLT